MSVIAALLALPAAAPAASSRIAWSRYSDQSFTAQRIVSARPDGSDLRVLTRSSNGTYDMHPKISPDGSRVVFERDLPGGEAQIVVVNAAGGGERVVDTGCTAPCDVDINPGWAPGGDRVVFSRIVGPFDRCNESAASAVLYTARLDGSDVRRLSPPGIDGEYEDYFARWSPDRSYIEFLRVRNCPYDSAVFRMDAGGTNVRRLTPWELDADLPDLSQATGGPTKDLVVFETFGHGGQGQDIATVPATCPDPVSCEAQISYLTRNLDGPTQSTNPAWSPTGTRIAFAEWTFPWDGHGRPRAGWYSDIFTMDATGGDRRQVSRSVHWDLQPDWGRTP